MTRRRLATLALLLGGTAACDQALVPLNSADAGLIAHHVNPAPMACNGHAELCGRAYDAVAFPGTHGAYTDIDEGFVAPDQNHPVARQLADGVRVLHFEVHEYQGDAYLCHGVCQFGNKRLVDDLSAVSAFVAAHPDEVVTLLLERSDKVITADDIGRAFEASGLASSVHTQAMGAPWPTLGQMIERGEETVALLDDTTGSSFPWLMPRWQWSWETPWDNEKPTDFSRCNADRGTKGNSIYVVDTYLEDLLVPTAAEAALVNEDPFLVDRLLYCRKDAGVMPNFVMVNYYDVGDLFHVVDVLNGFASAPALGPFPPSAWPDGGVP